MIETLYRICEQYTYAQIADRIKRVTGRVYSAGHIGNVARGSRAFSDSLHFNLMRAFPEFFLPACSPNGESAQTKQGDTAR